MPRLLISVAASKLNFSNSRDIRIINYRSPRGLRIVSESFTNIQETLCESESSSTRFTRTGYDPWRWRMRIIHHKRQATHRIHRRATNSNPRPGCAYYHFEMKRKLRPEHGGVGVHDWSAVSMNRITNYADA